MKKNTILISFLTLLTLTSYSQMKDNSHSPISVVSDNKDTLFLVNSPIGIEISEAWSIYIECIDNEIVRYHRERINKDPIIIMKDEDWIVTEFIKRNDGKKY